jgi:hypothetical protein
MTFLDHIETIEDTRKDINKTYELTDIIFLTMAAVLSGATGASNFVADSSASQVSEAAVLCPEKTCHGTMGIYTYDLVCRHKYNIR